MFSYSQIDIFFTLATYKAKNIKATLQQEHCQWIPTNKLIMKPLETSEICVNNLMYDSYIRLHARTNSAGRDPAIGS